MYVTSFVSSFSINVCLLFFIVLINIFQINGQNLKSSRIRNLEKNSVLLKLIRGVLPIVFCQ